MKNKFIKNRMVFIGITLFVCLVQKNCVANGDEIEKLKQEAREEIDKASKLLEEFDKENKKEDEIEKQILEVQQYYTQEIKNINVEIKDIEEKIAVIKNQAKEKLTKNETISSTQISLLKNYEHKIKLKREKKDILRKQYLKDIEKAEKGEFISQEKQQKNKEEANKMEEKSYYEKFKEWLPEIPEKMSPAYWLGYYSSHDYTEDNE